MTAFAHASPRLLAPCSEEGYRRSVGGKLDHELGAGTTVVHGHTPVMAFGNLLDDGEAEPGASGVAAAGVVEAGEPFEDSGP